MIKLQANLFIKKVIIDFSTLLLQKHSASANSQIVRFNLSVLSSLLKSSK